MISSAVVQRALHNTLVKFSRTGKGPLFAGAASIAAGPEAATHLPSRIVKSVLGPSDPYPIGLGHRRTELKRQKEAKRIRSRVAQPTTVHVSGSGDSARMSPQKELGEAGLVAKNPGPSKKSKKKHRRSSHEDDDRDSLCILS